MRKQIYICDRCKKEVLELYEYQRSMFSIKEKVSIIQFDFDLCQECNKNLREWVYGKKRKDATGSATV